MKDVVKNEIVNENQRKIFTKNDGKDIIDKKYNLFAANNKKYLQRKGLFMKNTKEIILDEVTKELNCKEKINTNVFTKNNGKDIIYNKYNLLNKNNDFYEREGLYMRKTEDIVLKRLNIVERVFFKKKFIEIYKEGVKAGFNWNNCNVR